MLKKRFASFLLTIGLAALILFVISLLSLQSRNNTADAGLNFNLLLIGLAASTAAYFLMKGAISESRESEAVGRFKTVKRMAAIRRGEIPKSERKKRKKKKKGEKEEGEDETNEDEESSKEKKPD